MGGTQDCIACLRLCKACQRPCLEDGDRQGKAVWGRGRGGGGAPLGMAKGAEGPPHAGGAEDAGLVIYDHLGVAGYSQRIRRRCKSRDCRQHVGQFRRDVRNRIYFEEARPCTASKGQELWCNLGLHYRCPLTHRWIP